MAGIVPILAWILIVGNTGSTYQAEYGLDGGVEVKKFLNEKLPNIDPDASQNWQIVDAFPNLTFVNPIYLLQEPGTDDLWVAEHAGKIYRFPRNENVTEAERTVILDISDQVKQDDVSGIKSFVFHPEYGEAGSPNASYIYIFYRYTPTPPAANEDAYLRVSRFSVLGDGTIDKSSEFVLIHQFSYNRWHDGGDMTFDNDGFLYISLGEDTNVANAQRLDGGLFGGILKIDVDMDPSRSHPIRRQPQNTAVIPAGWEDSYSQGYYIPNDNPWVDESGAYLEEYYAVGLRAPHRMTYDNVEDEIWIGEVGEGRREQILHLVKKANYGWPVWEGTLPGDKIGNVVLTEGDLTFPIYEYSHLDGQAVIGGHVYRGTEFAAELYGKYIYADYLTRTVHALSFDEVTGEPYVEFLAKAPAGGLLGGIGKDADNELYMIRFAGYNTTNGRIYKLERITQEVSNPPALLSQTGAFSNLSTMAPVGGLIPYEVINPLWSDGTAKQRWFAIPNNGTHNFSHEQIEYSEQGNWIFPTGSVFVKHFEYNDKKIETRFLVRGDDAQWYGLSYRWRDDQTDADLLDDGLITTIDVGGGESIDWQFPSRIECFQCHTDNPGTVLGLRTHQLNRDAFYPTTGRIANQLDTYAHIGLLGNDFDESQLDDVLTAVPLDDETAELSLRVRSYLDSNCSNCHQPSGTAVGLFDARLTTPLEEQNIVNGPVVKPIVPDPVVISPGDLGSSVLFVRMNSLEEGVAMPPLARHVLDQDALTVLSRWIAELGAALPVDLAGFQGIADGSSVILDWRTLSEQNNYGFEVERRTQTTAFETIGFVEGMGTTDVEQEYRFVDETPVSNGDPLLYRLKQIDFDGRFEYSMEIEVEPNTPGQAILYDNYPDPFNPTTNIEYEVPAQLQVTLIVFDMLGREVARLVDADQPAGRYRVTLDAADLPSGTYVYRLVAGNKVIAKKLVLAK